MLWLETGKICSQYTATVSKVWWPMTNKEMIYTAQHKYDYNIHPWDIKFQSNENQSQLKNH